LQKVFTAPEMQSTPTEGQLDKLATLIFDAGVDGDEPSLRLSVDLLRADYRRRYAEHSDDDSLAEERRVGALYGYLKIARWARDCAPTLEPPPSLAPDTNKFRLLQAIALNPGLSNKRLSELLRLGEDEVSRRGKELDDEGLASKRRVGQHNQWMITSRGSDCLRGHEPEVISSPTEELESPRRVAELFSKELSNRGLRKSDAAAKLNVPAQYMEAILENPAGWSLRNIERAFRAIGCRITLDVENLGGELGDGSEGPLLKHVSPPGHETRDEIELSSIARYEEQGAKVLP